MANALPEKGLLEEREALTEIVKLMKLQTAAIEGVAAAMRSQAAATMTIAQIVPHGTAQSPTDLATKFEAVHKAMFSKG